MSPSTAAEMIQLMVKQGRTVLEAVREFCEEELKKAVTIELDEPRPPHSFGPLFELMCEAGFQEREERDMAQAVELWLAGWTSEKPSKSAQVMSWYWRSPPKGKRPLGRQYLSTQQAFNAMKRNKS